jgi:hypothetical protein
MLMKASSAEQLHQSEAQDPVETGNNDIPKLPKTDLAL